VETQVLIDCTFVTVSSVASFLINQSAAIFSYHEPPDFNLLNKLADLGWKAQLLQAISRACDVACSVKGELNTIRFCRRSALPSRDDSESSVFQRITSDCASRQRMIDRSLRDRPACVMTDLSEVQDCASRTREINFSAPFSASACRCVPIRSVYYSSYTLKLSHLYVNDLVRKTVKQFIMRTDAHLSKRQVLLDIVITAGFLINCMALNLFVSCLINSIRDPSIIY